MASWTIEPMWKKSLREIMYFSKDDKQITVETGWRWGQFTCETEDDTPPVIKEGIDLYSQGYDVEMYECIDGCWEDYEFEGFSEEEEEEMREWLDENSFLDLEEDGWMQTDCEMIIDNEIKVEKAEA
jgi:hypothetical protein